MMRHDRGSATLEAVIILPATLLMLAVIVMAGRIALAQQALQAIAADAARAASLARTSAAAKADAETVAGMALTTNGLNCASRALSVETAGLQKAAGATATVSARISCSVNLSDLSLPGIPGSLQLAATGISPVDPYRER